MLKGADRAHDRVYASQGHEFLIVGMTLEEGISKTYSDNDMVLVSYVRTVTLDPISLPPTPPPPPHLHTT